MRKLLIVLVVLVTMIVVSIGAEIRIAMQFGLGYAPVMLLDKLNLIEKYAPGTKVTWLQLGSGAAINEALIAGKADIGSMGVGPYLIGIDKGAPWKMAAALVIQPLGLQVNDPNIKSLKDIKPTDRIALPAPGSIQHIILAMAAEKELGSPNALDNNLVAMAHPDGAIALMAGGTGITGHFTSPPYIFEELQDPNIHQVVEGFDAFGGQFTFLVSVATEKFHDNNPMLYAAFVQALSEAISYINSNPEKTAELLAPDFGLTVEQTLKYLTWPGTNYTITPYGIMGFAEFMTKAGYLDRVPGSYDEIAWENITAIIGKSTGQDLSPVERAQGR